MSANDDAITPLASKEKKERLIFCDIDFELKVVIMSAKTRGD